MHAYKCPEITFSGLCLQETGRRLNERILEHTEKEQKSQILKHTLQSAYSSVSSNEFTITRRENKNYKGRRKISEALLTQKYQPSLNMQENIVPKELFS